jgi:hypothetical protein
VGKIVSHPEQAAQQIVNIIQSEINSGRLWRSNHNIGQMADILIETGRLPKGDKNHAEMVFDIKLSLYSDNYLDLMHESYSKNVTRTCFFNHLQHIYVEAACDEGMLDRIESVDQMLREISVYNRDPAFIVRDQTHPRFMSRMQCEVDRIGIRGLIRSLGSIDGQSLLRLMHNYIDSEHQKWEGYELNEYEYKRLMDFLSSHFEIDEIIDLTLYEEDQSLSASPYWVKQFDLDELIERFRFTDINTLFAGEKTGIGFGFPQMATKIALLKATVCAETKELLKAIPDEMIKPIKDKGILPKSLLAEFDWLDASEKRKTLEQDMGL